MTAIVGVLCRDGAVIGADSSSSFSTPQTRTIEQPTKKIHVIGGQVVLAGTGQVGLNQRFHQILTEYWQKGDGAGKPHIHLAKDLCAKAVSDFASTSAPKGQYGALLAFPSNKQAKLCEFAVIDFQPEFKNESMWFVSLGSGQPITDPFLGLMRKVFWSDGLLPTVDEATFTVAWTLQHVIELNPGGINGPIQMATLRDGKATMLSPEDILEHMGNIEGAIGHLRKYKDILAGKDGKTLPDLKTLVDAGPKVKITGQ